MKINSKELKTAVENCCRIVPKKVAHAILACVRIEGNKRNLKITATNLEEFYSVSVPGKKGEKFDITVDAHQLLKVIKNIKEENLELELERGSDPEDVKLKIASGMTFRLKASLEDGDFPVTPVKVFKKSRKVELYNQKVLFEILRKVGFSTTHHNVNKAYSGILFTGKGSNLEVVTTDIHRLSVVRTKVAKTKKDFVIPVDSAKNVLKIFATTGITGIELASDTSSDASSKGQMDKILIKSDNEIYISRLLKNEFPNYEQVLKPEVVEGSWYEVDKKKIQAKLKSVIDFHTNAKIVAGAFDFVGNSLFINSSGEEDTSVETSVEMKVVNIRSSEVKIIGLNVKYLHEAIANMDNIIMNFESGRSFTPFYLTDRQPDYTFFHLVMPVRMERLKSRNNKKNAKAA